MVEMTRPKFQTRTIRLIGEQQVELACAAVRNAPRDAEHPLEFVLREERKTRKPDQNQAMWAGPLRDIAEQAWVDGRQYRVEVWHEFYKEKFLPEDDDSELETLVREGYQKWAYDPDGKRRLIGSTTQLTVRGMAIYMQQVEAHGASMGVQFHESPNKWTDERRVG